MDIDTDGEWTVHVAQPRAPSEEIRTMPVSASGEGSAVVGPVEVRRQEIVEKTDEDGQIIQQVCDEFRQGGYNVTWDILNAANYGVPQKRRRTFIMGNRIEVVAQP